MKNTVNVWGHDVEYNCLAGWLKYLRLDMGISQEALSYGICSISHLSYFENGKKKLRGDVIENLFKKLNILEIGDIKKISNMKFIFLKLRNYIETFNESEATRLLKEIEVFEEIITASPYFIEFLVYKFIYKFFISKTSLEELEDEFEKLENIKHTLSDDIKYVYFIASGKYIYDYYDHEKGIEILLLAKDMNDSSWINYRLGVAYLLNNEYLKGVIYLENAVETYSKSGRYYNSLLCHQFLGRCYHYLDFYSKAEEHYNIILEALDNIPLDRDMMGIHIDLAILYLKKGNYKKCYEFCKEHMIWYPDSILGVCTTVQVCAELNMEEEINHLFKKYLNEEYSSSVYYNFLYFLYLKQNHFTEVKFYNEVVNSIMPYYEKIGYLIYLKPIKLSVVEYLENNRKYKEALSIYKTIK
ncbi:helix-turn-helix transcriptional regulator [Oceanirhabdus sp. W0125-5]|uniref:helix-turn-helix transcriptional regulator n=1 Tax=Oceanirhabdus sp. W0125-5 TaxID=2999116 RepID=UPI0022F2FA89|nr:helix-turn-helix transcriptional regulator [Oceanirhabdus sp. W0125-5]WBW95075.1 helix-turn-helix transcriptional regulator [Oceanirhabdus sp. W0125-5]